MKIVAYLTLVSLVLGVTVAASPLAAATGCKGVVGLVNCVKAEVLRDVGVVANAVCLIVFGQSPCLYIDGTTAATPPAVFLP